jgi:hypothetical protein
MGEFYSRRFRPAKEKRAPHDDQRAKKSPALIERRAASTGKKISGSRW